MEIRPATEADVDVMRRLWEEFNAEATFTPYPAAPFEPSLVTDHFALVAEENGDAVGRLRKHQQPALRLRLRPLHPSAGAPSRRRTALMLAIAVEVREQGRQYVVLSVDTPNEGGRALYDGLGFVDAARILRADVKSLVEG
jgi:hypothetical protein